MYIYDVVAGIIVRICIQNLKLILSILSYLQMCVFLEGNTHHIVNR